MEGLWCDHGQGCHRPAYVTAVGAAKLIALGAAKVTTVGAAELIAPGAAKVTAVGAAEVIAS